MYALKICCSYPLGIMIRISKLVLHVPQDSIKILQDTRNKHIYQQDNCRLITEINVKKINLHESNQEYQKCALKDFIQGPFNCNINQNAHYYFDALRGRRPAILENLFHNRGSAIASIECTKSDIVTMAENHF